MQGRPQKKSKAQVWVLSTHEEELYALLLKLIPERGAYWQPVTGGIEEGESPKQGALREAWEETGFDPFEAMQVLGHRFEYESRWGKVEEEAFYFFAVPGLPEPKLDVREHTDFRWTKLTEVESFIRHESQLEVIRKIRERLKKNDSLQS
ncbi:MAG: NUDIX domain-containing protein [Proteobacteria bacterium]|nr:MAG: NUDIX domain-containing protein [Pseudomonadota bacterium]